MTLARPLTLCVFLGAAALVSAQEAAWVPTGGPRSGYTRALTEAPDGSLFVVAGGDLYRSDDAGRGWNPVPSPLGEIARLAIDTEGDLFVWSYVICTETCNQEGAYASSDGGETWTRIAILGTFPLVSQIEAGADGRVFALTDAGFFLSEDGGVTWTPVSLDGTSRSGSLAAHPAGFVAVYQHPDADVSTLSYSSDNGETWVTHPIPPELPPLSDLRLDARGGIVAARAHSPNEALYRSPDEGLSWTTIPFPAPCSTDTPCTLDAFDVVRGALFASFSHSGDTTSLGVFRTDDGLAWTALGLEGPAAANFEAAGDAVLAATSRAVFRYEDHAWHSSSEGLARSWTDVLAWGSDDTLYAGAFEGDVSRYDTATETWAPLPYLKFPMAFAPAPDGRLFAGVSGEPGAWVLDVAGETWTPVGLRNVVALLRTEAGALLAGAWNPTPSLSRSTDDGASWTVTATFNPLTFLETDGSVYVGTGTGVYRSTDDGMTWESLGPGDAVVTGLSMIGGTLWAASPYDELGNSRGRVFRSTDGGANWTLTWTAPLNHQIRSVVATAEAVYVTAGLSGLYRSADEGATWKPFASGLPERGDIQALALGPDGRLYAGVDYWSVYRTAQPVTTASAPAPVVHPFALHPPRPNPATRQTVVPFEVPAPAHVRVGVYDVLGREVAVLLDGATEAGRHEVTLDGAGLAAGVYVVRATAVEPDGKLRAAVQRLTLVR